MSFATEKPNQQTATGVLLVLSPWEWKSNVSDPKRTFWGYFLWCYLPYLYTVLGEQVNPGSPAGSPLPRQPWHYLGGKTGGTHLLCLPRLGNNGLLFSSELNISYTPAGVQYSKLKPNSLHKYFSDERRSPKQHNNHWVKGNCFHLPPLLNSCGIQLGGFNGASKYSSLLNAVCCVPVGLF